MPFDLGIDEKSKETITKDIGRYGPYIRCGKLTRSVPDNKNLLELTEADAVELLKSDPSVIKTFDSSDVVIKKGRFNRINKLIKELYLYRDQFKTVATPDFTINSRLLLRDMISTSLYNRV